MFLSCQTKLPQPRRQYNKAILKNLAKPLFQILSSQLPKVNSLQNVEVLTYNM